MKLFCPIHNKFLQIPKDHLKGSGCWKCKDSTGEKIINNILNSLKYDFIKEKTFKNCIYNGRLRFDFYIPELNCLIEFDGIQHFQKINYHKFDKWYNARKIKDTIKNKFCLENKIPLLRISYKEYKFIPVIIESFLNRVKMDLKVLYILILNYIKDKN